MHGGIQDGESSEVRSDLFYKKKEHES